MRFHAAHGVSEQELTVGNEFEVTVEVDYPFERALESDNLSDTLNYAELYDVVAAQMAIPSALIERTAGRIIDAIKLRFPLVEGGRITLVKLSPPITGQVAGAAVTVSF